MWPHVRRVAVPPRQAADLDIHHEEDDPPGDPAPLTDDEMTEVDPGETED